MRINPIFHKHLTVSASQKRFYGLMALYLGLISLFNLGFMSIIITTNAHQFTVSLLEFYTQGRMVYWTSSMLMLLTVALLTPTTALTAFAGEHERLTWDLLKVTTLSARDLVLGKLSGTLATAALYLLAPLPLLLTGYWLGNVGLVELLITLGFIFVTMFATTCLALFLSARLLRTTWAVFTYYGLLLAMQPVAGIVGALYAFLRDRWLAGPVPAAPSVLAETAFEHGWVIFIGAHPLLAAITSVALAQEHHNWFVMPAPLSRISGATVTLPLPWVSSTIFLLLLGFTTLLLTMKIVAKPER